MRESNIVAKARFDKNIQAFIRYSVALTIALTIVGIPFVLVWLLVSGSYTKRYYRNLGCFLTDSSLIVRKGVLFKKEIIIPLEDVHDLTQADEAIPSWFGLHSTVIETMGRSSDVEASILGMKYFHNFRDKVIDQRDLLRSLGPEGIAAARAEAAREAGGAEGGDGEGESALPVALPPEEEPIPFEPDSQEFLLVQIRNSLLRMEKRIKRVEERL